MRRSRPVAVLAVCGLPQLALADLPLSVEDIFTAHHRYRVDASMEYRNWESSDLSSFYVNSVDSSVLSFGLRYGVTLRTEGFLRAYGFHSEQRTQSLARVESDSQTDWSRLVAGINHQFSADNSTPALLGFLGVDLLESSQIPGEGVDTLGGASGGFTTYRSLDPLLLSAVVRYDWRGDRRLAGSALEPGDGLALSPRVAFAVNHLVTLTGGFKWEWRESPRWNDEDLGVDRTRTSILLGLGYSWNADTTVSIDGEFAVTDSEGSSLSVTVVYRFDDRSVFR